MKKATILLLSIVLLLIGCDKEQDNIRTEQNGVPSTFVDQRDGQIYQCITINGQTWMAENLKYRLPLGGYDGCISYKEKRIDTLKLTINKEIFKDSLVKIVQRGEMDVESARYIEMTFLEKRNQVGYKLSLAAYLQSLYNPATGETNADMLKEYIPLLYRINQRLQNEAIEVISKKYTDYQYVKEYGYLYSYDAAQRAIPKGWRIPTDEDWKKLEKTLGIGEKERDELNQWRGEKQGEMLKNSQQLGFYAKMTGGQAYGITSGHAAHSFINIGVKTYFWTSTEGEKIDSLSTNIIRALQYNNPKIYRGTSIQDSEKDNKRVYFSVRCVKNDEPSEPKTINELKQ